MYGGWAGGDEAATQAAGATSPTEAKRLSMLSTPSTEPRPEAPVTDTHMKSGATTGTGAGTGAAAKFPAEAAERAASSASDAARCTIDPALAERPRQKPRCSKSHPGRASERPAALGASTKTPSTVTSLAPSTSTTPPRQMPKHRKINNLVGAAQTKAAVEAAIAPLQAQLTALQERMDAQHAEHMRTIMPSPPPTPRGLRADVHGALLSVQSLDC